MSGYISTHVLNMVTGRPGAGIECRLMFQIGTVDVPQWTQVASGATDDDGRISCLLGTSPKGEVNGALNAGRYRLEFELEGYFQASGLDSFLPEAVIGFVVADPSEHFHVPLLLSPNGFSTYRGS